MSEAQLWLVDYLTERYAPYHVQPECTFGLPRKWRFDVGIPELGLAFEIEGGIFIQGRHTRGAAYQKDMEKYNTAAAMGWKVFRFTPKQILRGEAKQFLEEHVKRHSLA